MSTFRELIYMVADLAKQVSDDDTLNYNHIAFLLKKYRSYLLKQKYVNAAQEIPQSNYQTVCVNLEQVTSGASCTYSECADGGGNMLRSTSDISVPISFSDSKISIFRCPGEYSLTLNIANVELTQEQVEYINELFSSTQPFVIPDYEQDEDGEKWSNQGGYEYLEYNGGDYFIYDPDDLETPIPSNVYYYEDDELYTVDRDIPLYYLTGSSDIDSYIYQTNCSEDVETIISLLERKGISATLNKVSDSTSACNEETFYTEAIKKFGNISYVNKQRFAYTGFSKYNKNGMYATVGIDNYLYVKSNRDLTPFNRAIVTAIFEDPIDAYDKSSCTYEYTPEGATEPVTTKCPEGGSCDPWDMEFPIEDALQPALIDITLKEFLGAAYRPKDDRNNNADDIADIVAYVRQNMKQQYVKQQQPNDVE